MSIKEEFPQLKAALLLRSPFLASLLMRARIVITRSIPTAAITDNYTILINDQFIDSLQFEDKVFVLCHEVLHIALNHIERSGRDIMKWNIATDAVVNRLLEEMIKPSCKFKTSMITMETLLEVLNEHGLRVEYKRLEKMSAEEIYALLLDMHDKIEIRIQDLTGVKEESGEVLQDGDPGIYGGKDKGGEKMKEMLGTEVKEEEKKRLADAWKQALVKAYIAQKSAGTVPGYTQFIIDKMLEAKVSWRTLLKEAFRYGYGRTILSTYKRVSRKHEALPGHRRYTLPNVYVLVDTSGSINERELEQFIGELYEIAKISTVIVVPWDARVYEPIITRRASEVVTKVMSKMKGRGGTVIKHALEYVNSNMKMRDIVVILTDGMIHDLNEEYTMSLFDEVATKASVAVLVSTYKDVEMPRWRFIKLSALMSR